MAARLETKMPHAFGREVWLGGWLLGSVYRLAGWSAGSGDWYRYSLTDASVTESEPYQSIDDCAQDLESEVRRLLKEAGVDLAD